MIRALLAAGLPPYGLGVYLRDTTAPLRTVGFRWAAIIGLASESRRREQLSAAGGGWYYSLVDSWRPQNWERTLGTLMERAAREGAVGIIADPENGWPQLARAERERELERLGRALSQAAESTRVGITSYPLFPSLDVLGAAAGDRVWGSPQIYGGSTQDQAVMAQWYARWEAVFGLRLIPSIAAYVPQDRPGTETMRSADGYAAYLSRLPRAGGAIAFPGAVFGGSGDGIPDHMIGPLRAYEPGGSALGTAAYALRAAVLRPAGLALVAIVLAIGILATLGARSL